jgi:hypothetical protein
LFVSVCALAAACLIGLLSLLSLGFVGEIGINPSIVPSVLSPPLLGGVLSSPCLPLSGVLTVVPSPVLSSVLSPPESRGVVAPCTGAAILGAVPTGGGEREQLPLASFDEPSGHIWGSTGGAVVSTGGAVVSTLRQMWILDRWSSSIYIATKQNDKFAEAS